MNVHRDLIVETGNLLGEPRSVDGSAPTNGTAFLNADVTVALTEAADEFNRLTKLYRVKAAVAVETGLATYLIRDGNNNVPLGEIIRVEDANGNLLVETSPQELDNTYSGTQSNWRQEQGPLRCWYPEADEYGRLGLYPKPDSDQVVTVWFPAKASPMDGNSDSPWVGAGTATLQQYYYALPYYAAYKLLRREGENSNEQRAENLKSKFNEIIQQALADELGSRKAA